MYYLGSARQAADYNNALFDIASSLETLTKYELEQHKPSLREEDKVMA
jgi:hypothetical protein